MNDNQPETRVAGWDDDGNVIEAAVTGMTALAAAVATGWFFWRLAEVLS